MRKIELKRSSVVNRFVAFVTFLTFLSTNIFSKPLFAVQTPAAAKESVIQQDINQIRLPKSLGKIESITKGNKDRTVIVIQDAHEIPSAQKSIYKIIKYLTGTYGIKLVGVEGANARLNGQIFKSFPDKKKLKHIFGDYFNNGELAGAVAAEIFANPSDNIVFHGIEDWNLYEQGLEYFLKSLEAESPLLEKISAEEQKLDTEKKRSFSPQLLAIDSAWQKFQENQGDINGLLKLVAAVKRPDDKEILAVVEEIESQSKSGADVQAEAAKIAGKLKSSLISKSANKDLAVFNQKSQLFQTSQLSPQAFVLEMKQIAVKNKISLEIPKSLKSGVRNQKTMKQMEGTRFFQSLNVYVDSVKDQLLTDIFQKELNERTHRVSLLKKLARLELTQDEWKEVRDSGGAEFSSAEEAAIFKNAAAQFSFYRTAEKRDGAFMKKLDQVWAANFKSKTSIMVSGGFHAQGLVRHLTENGFGVILIMPDISQIPSETNYRAHMRGDVSWKNYFEVEEGKINLYKAFVRGTRDKLLKREDAEGVDPRLLKEWRDQIIRDLAEEEKIESAGDYTRFLDEVAGNAKSSKLNTWMEKIHNFVKGLHKLESEKQLNEQNIFKLMTATQAVGVPIDPTASLPAPDFSELAAEVPGTAVNRAEVRAAVVWEASEFKALNALADDLSELLELGYWGKDLAEQVTESQGRVPAAIRLKTIEFYHERLLRYFGRNFDSARVTREDVSLYRQFIERFVEALRIITGASKLGQYSDSANINGIEITVGWDDLIDAYQLKFPGIKSPDRGFNNGVLFLPNFPFPDKGEALAREAFDYAKTMVRHGFNVYDIFKEVKTFLGSRAEVRTAAQGLVPLEFGILPGITFDQALERYHAPLSEEDRNNIVKIEIRGQEETVWHELSLAERLRLSDTVLTRPDKYEHDDHAAAIRFYLKSENTKLTWTDRLRGFGVKDVTEKNPAPVGLIQSAIYKVGGLNGLASYDAFVRGLANFLESFSGVKKPVRAEIRTTMPVRDVLVDAENKSVLLNVKYPAVLSNVLVGEISFDAKPEFHVTLVNRAMGELLAAKAPADRIEQVLNEAAAQTQFNIELLDEFRFVEKSYPGTDVPRRSIIQMARVSNLEEFYQKLEVAIPGLQLPRVPAHVTLWVSGNPYGIGISSQDELNQLSRPLSEAELTAITQAGVTRPEVLAQAVNYEDLFYSKEISGQLTPRAPPEVLEKLQGAFPQTKFELDLESDEPMMGFHRDRFFGNYKVFLDMMIRYGQDMARQQSKRVAVLDLSLGPAHPLAQTNWVNDQTSQVDHDFYYHNVLAQTASVDETQKTNREKLFDVWLSMLANQKPGDIVHLDHHYPSNILSTVSTAKILSDLIEYARRTGKVNVLENLKNDTFGIIDHSDPDSLLSHFLRTHAADTTVIPNTVWIGDAAIYNDYQILRGEPNLQGRVRVLYAGIRGIDERIRRGQWTYREGFAQIKAVLQYAIQHGGYDRGAAEKRYVELKAKNEDQWNLQDHLFMEGIQDEITSNNAVKTVMARPATDFSRVPNLTAEEVNEGFWSRSGEVLIFTAGKIFPVSGPDLARNMYQNQFAGTEGVKFLIVLKPDLDPSNGYQVKFQQLVAENGESDSLTALYPALQNEGFPEAGGRATAGSLGFKTTFQAGEAGAPAAKTAEIRNRVFQALPRHELRVVEKRVLRDYPAEIEKVALDYRAAKEQGNTAEAQQLQAKRLSLAKEYVWKEIGSENPLIAQVVQAYLTSDNVTDLQVQILNGGVSAAKSIRQLRDVARFERQSMATGWMESPDKKMRHTRADAIDLEAEIAKVSKFYAQDEQDLVKDQERYWAKDTQSTKNRSADAKWQKFEGDAVDPVINEARALEPIMVLLLRHIAMKAGLSDETSQFSHRAKSKASALKKIAKNRSHPEWGKWAEDFSLASLFDLLGGRFVVSDLATLEDLMVAIDQYFKFEIGKDAEGRPQVNEESSVIRKENKFITNRLNPEKPDPYRAVQYTIGFPSQEQLIQLIQQAGADLKLSENEIQDLVLRVRSIGSEVNLHSFELQIKTEKGSMASDMWHDIGFKDLMGMGAFTQIVDGYNWNSLFEDLYGYAVNRNLNEVVGQFQEYENEPAIIEEARQFAQSKGYQGLELEQAAKAIAQSIASSDVNRFYDLVLSGFGASTVLPEDARVLIRRFFDREKQKLIEYKKTNPEKAKILEEAAHEGYIESSGTEEALKPKGDQFGWKLPPEAIALLSPEAKQKYDNRFKNFKNTNKLTVADLGLMDMDDATLGDFFEASGKFVRMTIVKAGTGNNMTGAELLFSRILQARDSNDSDLKTKVGKTPVMNLFHATHAEQYEAADREFEGEPDLRQAWLDRLNTNQLGTVTSASILTEIVNHPVLDYKGQVVRDPQTGKIIARDLGETVASLPEKALSFSRREMLIFWFFMAAINPKHAKAGLSYEKYVETEDPRWVKIDGAMDKAVATALIKEQLSVLRERIRDSHDNIRIATDITLRRDLTEKYLRSVGLDVQVLERWLNYLDEKYSEETAAFLARESDLGPTQMEVKSRVLGFAARNQSLTATAAKSQFASLDATAERVADLASTDSLLPLLSVLDLSFADIKALKPNDAETRLAQFKRSFERHVSHAMEQTSRWLDTKMNAAADQTGVLLTQDSLDEFYFNNVEVLARILEGTPDPAQWNEATWEAYLKYSDKDKWNEATTAQSPEDLARGYAASGQGVNVEVLKLLIEADRMVATVKTGFISQFTQAEKELFAETVHDNGYYAQQSARAASSTDYLLPVQTSETGGIVNTFLAPDGTDLLKPDSRTAFDARNDQPGKPNLPKVSLGNLRLENEEDLQRILDLFKSFRKKPEMELEVDVADVGKVKLTLEELLRKSLTEEAYRKALSSVEIFNAFVRPWKAMLTDADKTFNEKKDNGESYKKQIKFIYNKQYDAIAYVLLLAMIPELFRMQMRARSDSARKRFMDIMNRVVNVFWRVTNPWDHWKDKALIRLGYDQLDALQQSKDAAIWQAVLKLYYLTLFRLPGSDYANLQKLPKERVHERNALVKGQGEGADPGEFYRQKNSEGFHFIGVTTASGKGIATDQIPAAKNSLRQAFRNIMAHKGISDPSKIIITSGGTGNWDPGTMSGVDLVYEVAEEMGFKTMSVFPTDAFNLNFPIRNTDFYLHSGDTFGQESEMFYQFTDSLVTMAGGDQAYKETLAEIPQLARKGGIAYLIQGIETQKANKTTNLKVAPTDAPEIRLQLLAQGPDGSVVAKVVSRDVTAVDELNVSFSGVSKDNSNKKSFINPEGLRPARSFDELETGGVVRAEIRPEDVLKILKTPSQIRAALEAKGAAIVLGAGGMGKSEHIQAAVADKSSEVFDLRGRFIEHKMSTGATEEERTWDYWSAIYRDVNKPEIKKEELEWVKDQISKFEAKSDTVIFDEIDLSQSPSLNPDELETFKTILEFAGRLKAQGKQVVFVMHENGVKTPGVLDLFRAQGFLGNENEIVRPGYLSPVETQGLLEIAGFESAEYENYQREMNGLPTAYLSFLINLEHLLKNKISVPLDLAAQRKQTIEYVRQNYRGILKRSPALVVDQLKSLASGELTVDSQEIVQNREALLATGLVGDVDGKLIFPEIAGIAILTQEWANTKAAVADFPLERRIEQSDLDENQKKKLLELQSGGADHLMLEASKYLSRAREGDESFLLGASVPRRYDKIPPKHSDVYRAFLETVPEMKGWRQAYEEVGIPVVEATEDTQNVENARGPEFFARLIQKNLPIVFLVPSKLGKHNFVRNELQLLLGEKRNELERELKTLGVPNPEEAIDNYLSKHAKFVFGARETLPAGVESLDEIKNYFQNLTRAEVLPHEKARTGQPQGYSQRAEVPDEKVNWKVPFEGYAAPLAGGENEALPNVIQASSDNPENLIPGTSQVDAKKGWAHPTDYYTRSGVVFKSYVGEVDRDELGRPKNPMGRTGLQGRGALGKWGRNLTADSVFSMVREGVTKVALIQRADGTWAIPGGMVDDNDSIDTLITAIEEKLKKKDKKKVLSGARQELIRQIREALNEKNADVTLLTAVREFMEETGNLVSPAAIRKAKRVYAGYVDDPRNTDNAWTETGVWKLTAESEADIAVTGIPRDKKEGIRDIQWKSFDEIREIGLANLYASHGEFLGKIFPELRAEIRQVFEDQDLENILRAVVSPESMERNEIRIAAKVTEERVRITSIDQLGKRMEDLAVKRANAVPEFFVPRANVNGAIASWADVLRGLQKSNVVALDIQPDVTDAELRDYEQALLSAKGSLKQVILAGDIKRLKSETLDNLKKAGISFTTVKKLDNLRPSQLPDQNVLPAILPGQEEFANKLIFEIERDKTNDPLLAVGAAFLQVTIAALLAANNIRGREDFEEHKADLLKQLFGEYAGREDIFTVNPNGSITIKTNELGKFLTQFKATQAAGRAA